jgi:hypothetical protein
MNSYAESLSSYAQEEGYTVVGDYVNSSTKIKFQHTNGGCAGFEFEMSPNKFMQGRRCPRCAGVENW